MNCNEVKYDDETSAIGPSPVRRIILILKPDKMAQSR